MSPLSQFDAPSDPASPASGGRSVSAVVPPAAADATASTSVPASSSAAPEATTAARPTAARVELPLFLARSRPDAEYWALCEASLRRAQANIARQDAASALGPPPTSRPSTPRPSTPSSLGLSSPPTSPAPRRSLRGRKRPAPDYSDSEDEGAAGASATRGGKCEAKGKGKGKGKGRVGASTRARTTSAADKAAEEELDELVEEVPPPPPPLPRQAARGGTGWVKNIPPEFDPKAVPAYHAGEVVSDWLPPVQHSWTVCLGCLHASGTPAQQLDAVKTCSLAPDAKPSDGAAGSLLPRCHRCEPDKRPCDYMMRLPTFPNSPRGRMQERLYACRRHIWLEGGCVGERPRPDVRPESLTEEEFRRLFTPEEQEKFLETWRKSRGGEVTRNKKRTKAGKEEEARAASVAPVPPSAGPSSRAASVAPPAKRARKASTPAAAPVAVPSVEPAAVPAVPVPAAVAAAPASSAPVAPAAPARPPTAVARRSASCGGLEAALDRLDEAAQEVIAASQVVNRELRGAGVPASEVSTSAIPLLGALEEHAMALREAAERASIRLAGAANK
ncbi:uncharacterized protein PSFLO_04407 [Pseudozyma flocculosa]|uniref:Uncharacterized protein n=1 Tax=Pseudozyma flocculosa TaxID=84751 RepID=A0A5C3F3B3_9BASI|nr:uncharacterized protein PSFLO_04407 [Pseudozyma flocculosa]